jgi:hypothetical protein
LLNVTDVDNLCLLWNVDTSISVVVVERKRCR